MAQQTDERLDQIARDAASTWCRCFKCDGTVNETHEKCDKEHCRTCLKWYNGYRTAKIALSDYLKNKG